ncbi:hypothetical protein [Pseudomonas grandcourensis]|uniref:hypothetical protein n=1 Tax=Pseudomonas grandcourensis TaxID=3136736 RepID=UPI0032664C03
MKLIQCRFSSGQRVPLLVQMRQSIINAIDCNRLIFLAFFVSESKNATLYVESRIFTSETLGGSAFLFDVDCMKVAFCFTEPQFALLKLAIESLTSVAFMEVSAFVNQSSFYDDARYVRIGGTDETG